MQNSEIRIGRPRFFPYKKEVAMQTTLLTTGGATGLRITLPDTMFRSHSSVSLMAMSPVAQTPVSPPTSATTAPHIKDHFGQNVVKPQYPTKPQIN